IQFAGRTADDFKDLRGRGLLLKRLAQIVGAQTQLLEQSRVLDGDDRLLGKVGEKIDLLVGKKAYLLAIDHNGSDQLVFPKNGYEDNHPGPGTIAHCDNVWFAFEIGRLGPN